MLQLVNDYYIVFLVISVLFFGLTLWIRIKKAVSKKDKLIYTSYSTIMGVFIVLLVLFKIGG